MFGPTLSNSLSIYLSNVETDLGSYNFDSQKMLTGFLPVVNKEIYVLGEELHDVVSQAKEKYLESARSKDGNQRGQYNRYEDLRKRLLTHVQHKKAHCETKQQKHPNEMLAKEFPKENDPQMKDYVRVFGQIEDFLWLLGTACEYKGDQMIGQNEVIQSLAKKLFEDLDKLPFSFSNQIVKDSLSIAQESYLRKDYSSAAEAIVKFKQQIGCA